MKSWSTKEIVVITATYGHKEDLALKMLLGKSLAQSTKRRMRIFLVNKNLPLYYWLKRRIGKEGAFERVILVLGREQV